MKLYKLTRTDDWSYDEYESCVVVADSPGVAKYLHPSIPTNYYKTNYTWDGYNWRDGNGYRDLTWADPETLDVEYLGEAREGLESGTVIVASFNAG